MFTKTLTVPGVKNNVARGILKKSRKDTRFNLARFHCDSEDALFITKDSTLFRIHPYCPALVGEGPGHAIAWNFRRVTSIENFEANPVETNEAFVCRKPDIAVRRSGNSRDGVLR